jgi:hypothetical protein
MLGVGPKWLQHGSGRYGGYKIAEGFILIVAPKETVAESK